MELETVEPIGSGSFGHVFKVYDTKLQQTVAIKRVKSRQNNPDLEHEARLKNF